MKLLLYILAIATISQITFAQKQAPQSSNFELQNTPLIMPKDDFFQNKLGFAASMFTGYGLSYAGYLGKGYWVEGTGSIYGSGGSNGSDFTSTLGFELQKDMYSSRDFRFYALLGASYWYDMNEYSDTYYVGPNYETRTYSRYESNYIASLAIGFEFAIVRHLNFNIEGGYRYQVNKFKTSDTYTYKRDGYDIGFGVGAGLYYAF